MTVLDAPLGEGLEVGNGFSKDEGVDIVCSLVGVSNLEVGSMPTNMIFVRGSISTKDI